MILPSTPLRIYERAGFKLVGTKEHDEFGKTLVGETWELDLNNRRSELLAGTQRSGAGPR